MTLGSRLSAAAVVVAVGLHGAGEARAADERTKGTVIGGTVGLIVGGGKGAVAGAVAGKLAGAVVKDQRRDRDRRRRKDK